MSKRIKGIHTYTHTSHVPESAIVVYFAYTCVMRWHVPAGSSEQDGQDQLYHHDGQGGERCRLEEVDVRRIQLQVRFALGAASAVSVTGIIIGFLSVCFLSRPGNLA